MDINQTKQRKPKQLIFEFLLHTLFGAVSFLVLALVALGVHYLRGLLALETPDYVKIGFRFIETFILILDSILFLTFILLATVRLFRATFYTSEHNPTDDKGVK